MYRKHITDINLHEEIKDEFENLSEKEIKKFSKKF